MRYLKGFRQFRQKKGGVSWLNPRLNTGWILLLTCLSFFFAVDFCHARENKTPDEIGIHYVIGYDRSGTMISKDAFARDKRDNFEEILANVNNKILQYLENELSSNDRITIALLGLTQRDHKASLIAGSRELFFKRFVYLMGPPHQSIDDVEKKLEEIKNKMSDRGFRRHASFPSVQQAALMKIAAPQYSGLFTRLIWVTDGVTNILSPKFQEELNDLANANLETVVDLSREIRYYYDFKEIKPPEITEDIKISFYDVIPKTGTTNIQLINKSTTAPFSGYKDSYSVFSSSFNPVQLEVRWNPATQIKFVHGMYRDNDNQISQSFQERYFIIDIDRIANELGRPGDSQFSLHLQFKDKYGNSFVTHHGPYPIGFSYNAVPLIMIIVIPPVIVFFIFFLLRQKKSSNTIETLLNAPPIPIERIRFEGNQNEINCQAMTGVDKPTEYNFILDFSNLDRLEGLTPEKSMRIKIKISGEYEAHHKCSKIWNDKEEVFFDNHAETRSIVIRKDYKSYRIPFLINLHCLENVPVTISMKIIDIPKEFREYYVLNTNTFSATFTLKPNPADTIKLWKWEFIKAADPLPLEKDDDEVLLGRIKFTRTSTRGEVEVDDSELSQLINYLKFCITDPRCYELETRNNVDIREEDVFFKSITDPTRIRNIGLYTQIYINAKQVDIKRKSQLSFKVDIESTDEQKVKVKLAGNVNDCQLIITPDYGDLYVAIDFGTTATTCVYGRPLGTGLTCHRAVLERLDVYGEPIYMIDSALLIDFSDISDPQNIQVFIGGEAHAKHSPFKKDQKLFLSFKTLIGRERLKISDNRYIKIETILVMIYQNLYRRLCLYNKDRIKREEIKRIAVAVPNSFPPKKIKIVKEAWAKVRPYQDDACQHINTDEFVFEKDNISVIQEAEAAVVLYAENTNIEGEKRILTNDNGGGTLDLGLVKISRITNGPGNSKIQIDLIQKCGYKLGGDTLDQIFAQIILDYYLLQFQEDELNKGNLFSVSCPVDDIKRIRKDMKTIAKELKELYSGGANISNKNKEKLELINEKKIDIDYSEIITYLNTSEEPQRQEYLQWIQEYRDKAVGEALNDLLVNYKGQRVDEIIYTGRGGLFKGLKEDLVKKLEDLYVLDTSKQNDCYPLDNLYKRIPYSENFSEEEKLKYCVAFGALYFSWKKDNELILSNKKIYGTYFITQGYDENMRQQLKSETNIYIDETSEPKQVFISLIKNGEEFKPDPDNPQAAWKVVKGKTNHAKASGGNCDIFYGQGADFIKDHKEHKIYKYELVDRLTGRSGYFPLEITIYDDSAWIIKCDKMIIEDSRDSKKKKRKDVKMYIPLTDEEFHKYWPYTKEDLGYDE